MDENKVYSDANSQHDLKAIAEIREAMKYLNKSTRIKVLNFCLEIEQVDTVTMFGEGGRAIETYSLQEP